MGFKLINKGKIIVAAAVLFIAAAAFYLWRDFHLKANVSDMPVPDILVENIEVNRNIDGKDWRFVSPRVEHKDGVVLGQSLDISVKDRDGGESRLFAASGTFLRDNNDVTLNKAYGAISSGGALYELTAGSADYIQSENVWFFKNTVKVSDENMDITGREGYFDENSSECLISGDARAEW